MWTREVGRGDGVSEVSDFHGLSSSLDWDWDWVLDWGKSRGDGEMRKVERNGLGYQEEKKESKE